jgi:glycosyltransferase involved in cell wall biosynthesis
MPELTVVICSLNGAEGVGACMDALARQSAAERLEVVVVDDGSTDGTDRVAEGRGARVIRHPTNRGLAAARNTGVLAASAPLVAFLDDDCRPAAEWAGALIASHREEDWLGVGGPVVSTSASGVIARYLERRSPLAPLEIELGGSDAVPYRLWLYAKRQWRTSKPAGRRYVYSLVGANMSFRRAALLEVGGFDERFTFGAEELDLCRRLWLAFPGRRFLFEPAARVEHEFEATLADTIRRSRAYGRGSARMWRKWPAAGPTVFPAPALVAGLALAARRRPLLLAAALALPHAAFPAGARTAIRTKRPEGVIDPYVQLLQEAAENVGFAQGAWRYRNLVPASRTAQGGHAAERKVGAAA